MPSILQEWVMDLGLRHQGTLLTSIRGCDTAPKDDPSKLFTRCLRSVILKAHCGDARKAATFIEHCNSVEVGLRFEAFRKNLDHYPHHYIMHLIHSVEIVGYKHPDESTMWRWRQFYWRLCKGLHMTPETEQELDERLNADEATFAARD